MGEPRRPRIPDPSATIPDFGPRPDLKTLEKRAEVMRMLEAESTTGPRSVAPPPRRANPILVLLIAVFVAVLAGSAGFLIMVFAGLGFYWIMGL